MSREYVTPDGILVPDERSFMYLDSLMGYQMTGNRVSVGWDEVPDPIRENNRRHTHLRAALKRARLTLARSPLMYRSYKNRFSYLRAINFY